MREELNEGKLGIGEVTGGCKVKWRSEEGKNEWDRKGDKRIDQRMGIGFGPQQTTSKFCH